MNYLDYQNTIIQETAVRITQGCETVEDKLEAVFNYVKNQIEFAFLPEADYIRASEVIQRGAGQCNNKSILFHALCKVLDIPSRLHFSSITKEIHRGLFKGLLFLLAPKEFSHSWIEVYYRGAWVPIDSFINDEPFYKGGKKILKEKGLKTGYSVSCAGGSSSSDFSLEGRGFVQMAAVGEDHGVYDNPGDYFFSGKHNNRVNPLKRWIYRLHVPFINRRIRKIRRGAF